MPRGAGAARDQKRHGPLSGLGLGTPRNNVYVATSRPDLGNQGTAQMDSDEHSDAELVRACRRGDRESFGPLVERYQRLVLGVVQSAIGRADGADDLAQEVFVTAWRSLGNLKDPVLFRRWLCGIARHLGSQARRSRRTELATAPVEVAGMADVRPNQLDRVVTAEQETSVWKALSTLPDDYREPLVLYYREGKSVETVARLLDLSPETVFQRLSRARKKLKEAVAALLEPALAARGPRKGFAVGVLAAISVSAVSTGADAATAAGTVAAKTAGLKLAAVVTVSAAVAATLAVTAVSAVRQARRTSGGAVSPEPSRPTVAWEATALPAREPAPGSTATSRPAALPRFAVPPAPAWQAAIKRVGERSYEIERSVLLKNAQALLGSVRFVPEVRDAKAVGLRLDGVRPARPFGHLGFEDGDVVFAINGLAISTAKKALEVFSAQMKSAPRIVIDLERGLERVTLEYDLR